ncbi:MAG: hypothetical protein HKO01_10725 [Flaviramulus sp.]|nr:hypothetical protein [Flaviramulus sp.]NNC50999.1 hypothetical protein [Flaviramulus sp.]
MLLLVGRTYLIDVWIPAFAGMTIIKKPNSIKYHKMEVAILQPQFALDNTYKI